MVVNALFFGLIVGCMVLGVVGTVFPLIPGLILVWLSLLAYVLVEGFQAVGVPAFILFTLLAIVGVTSDLWLPLLGAKVTGSSGVGIWWGILGSVVGFVILNLPGAIIGYAAGILIGEYRRQRNWQEAIKATLGGLAGIGVSKLIQLGASLLVLISFVWMVFSAN